jgi:hypothetical protein
MNLPPQSGAGTYIPKDVCWVPIGYQSVMLSNTGTYRSVRRLTYVFGPGGRTVGHGGL